ncbi:homeobox protein BEL1 homolog [Nymphaea colorata]|nr:homeobox protein BEL1 homolog [Nymphaea colorata]XP_049934446.1 homeobox protein BEL1 homolog [Nymphaea colorata]
MTPSGEPIPLNFEFMQHSFPQRVDLGSSQPQHVAQQIRRDKLRIQQHVSSSPSSSTPSAGISDPVLQSQEVEESRNSGLSGSAYSGFPGLGGLIPLGYDPNSLISAEMMSSSAAGRLPSFKGSVPESNSGWKCLNYQASTDCIANCMQNPSAQSSAVGSMVLGSVGGFPIYNLGGPPSITVLNPNCGGREDVQQHPVQQSQFLSRASQEFNIREQSQGLLLPSFGNVQSGQSGFSEWNHKQGGLKPQLVEESFIGREAINGWFRTDTTGQGLSLSLSFRNPTPESQLQHETRFGAENLGACPASACTIGHHEKRKQEPVGDCFSFQKDGPAAFISRIQKNPVPLGPFTGYATVLKNSKFLKPAQQLLDELCNVGKVAINSSSTSDDDGTIGKFHTNNDQFEIDGKCGNSGRYCHIPLDNPPCISSSVYLPTNEPAEPSRRNPVSASADHNEHRRKKNRLISMLDEVYRKYRHFCGQLQAVVASFESVAGLNNAAPYTSMAAKAMSRHFRHLKSAISNQLKFTCKVLGEDCFLSGTARGDEISKLGLEGGVQQRDAGSLRINEPQQQQVWRPQRGLPERAVAVLRAWLFEHFLHPYPTDTDKQTLAKQTGLTRSQVSNWFINARVRLWKPMVEEIHMMESRNSVSSDFSSVNKPESVAIIGESRSSQAFRAPDGRQNCDNSDHPLGHLLPTKQFSANVSQIPIYKDRSIGDNSMLYQQNEASVKTTRATGGIGGVYLSLGP